MSPPLKPLLALLLGLLAVRVVGTPAPVGTHAPVGEPQESPDPFWRIGPKSELSIVARSALRADDNIFLATSPTDDAVFEFAPGIRVAGEATALLHGELTLADTFTRYANHPRLNASLFSGDLNGVYFFDEKQSINLAAGFHESDENTVDLPGLVRRDTSTLGVDSTRRFTAETSLKVAVNSTHIHYRRRGYGDSTDLSVPLSLTYQRNAYVSLSTGYRFREFRTSAGRNSTDHFPSIGARGQVEVSRIESEETGRMLIGAINAGVITRRLAGGGSLSTLGLSANVTHQAGFADLGFTLNRDFDTSPRGEQRTNLDAEITAATKLNPRTIATASLAFRRLDYSVRKDDYLEAEIGPRYRWNKYITISGAYVWRHNYSDCTAAKFGNNVLRLSADLKY
ncbi:MAG: hypothetical protein RLZZ15_2975 [Verrucomicrobiota bacterium]|jgi:hypothetical protein